MSLFALSFTILAVPVGLLLEQVMSKGELLEIDTSAANHLHGWVREVPNLIGPLKVISFLGTPVWFYLICGAAIATLVRHKRLRLARSAAGWWTPS
jgi:hypothetical protein